MSISRKFVPLSSWVVCLTGTLPPLFYLAKRLRLFGIAELFYPLFSSFKKGILHSIYKVPLSPDRYVNFNVWEINLYICSGGEGIFCDAKEK